MLVIIKPNRLGLSKYPLTVLFVILRLNKLLLTLRRWGFGQVFNFQTVIVVTSFAFRKHGFGNFFDFQMRIVFRFAAKRGATNQQRTA